MKIYRLNGYFYDSGKAYVDYFATKEQAQAYGDKNYDTYTIWEYAADENGMLEIVED